MAAAPRAVALAEVAAQAALDKGGERPLALDVSDRSPFTDIFLVVTAQTDRNVRTVGDAVAEALRDQGVRLRASEGTSLGRWALLDFCDVVVHVMQPEQREFYALERVWRDAPLIELAAQVTAD